MCVLKSRPFLFFFQLVRLCCQLVGVGESVCECGGRVGSVIEQLVLGRHGGMQVCSHHLLIIVAHASLIRTSQFGIVIAEIGKVGITALGI